MKCGACGHVSQDSTPKFCSECGARMVLPVGSTEIQGDGGTPLSSISDLGKELRVEEVYTTNGRGNDLQQASNVHVDKPSSLEDGLTDPPAKKKKKKKKKKGANNNSHTQNSLASVTSSLESCSFEEKPRDEMVSQDDLTSKKTAQSENISPSPSSQNDIPVIHTKTSLHGADKNSAVMHTAHEDLKVTLHSECRTNIPSAEENTTSTPVQKEAECPESAEEKRKDDTPSENDLKCQTEDGNGNPKEATKKNTISKKGNNKKEASSHANPEDTTAVKEQKETESQNKNGKKNQKTKGPPERKTSSNVNLENRTATEKQNDKESKNEAENLKQATEKETSSDISVESATETKREMESKNKNKNESSREAPVSSTSSNSNPEATTTSNTQTAKGSKNKKNNKASESHKEDPKNKTTESHKEDPKNKTTESHKKDPKNKTVDSEANKRSQFDSNKKDNVEKQEKNQLEGAAGERASSGKNAQNPEPANKQADYIRSVNPADLVTVYFHVIVSKDFKLNSEKDGVIVRAGGMTGYKDWKDTVCQMVFTRDLKEHGLLYEGQTNIPKQNLDTYIPYKYVVLRSKNIKEAEYEYIYKLDHTEGTHVNRCLHIPSESVCQREWHQYDDIACLKQNKNILDHLKKFIGLKDQKNRDIFNGKMIAAEVMLQSVFSILTTCDAINVSNFFSQLKQFCLVTTKSLVFEERQKPWTSHNFGKLEVDNLILKFLDKICQPFINQNVPPENVIINNRLAAGIICLLVCDTNTLPTTKNQLAQLCSVLCLEEMPRKNLLGELENMKILFSSFKGTEVYVKLFCQRCLDEDVDHWVWVLPVLHTFSDSSNPDDSQMETKPKPEEIWAGLEGLLYEKLLNRCQTYKSDLQFMIRKKHLLQSDRTLIRSWLCLVPVELMPTFLEKVPQTFLDVLTACCYKFQKVPVYINIEKVGAVLKELLKMMQDLKDRSPQAVSFQVCCNTSLKLHSIICTNTTLMKHSELPALSAQIILNLLTSAGLEGTCNEVQSRVSVIENILQNTLNLTRKWFQTHFGHKFPYRYSSLFYEELQVWNRFLIGGENVTDQWKESLLSDLVRKIKQEEPKDQIQIYCREQTQFKKLHVSIGKCFEDCAIGAVHSACQSQNNILSQLKTYNLENFGRLVSAIITNSWPIDELGKPIKDYDQILQHILQWADATHMFKLYGSDQRIISQFSEDIQELVALSESVFQEANSSLMIGNLQVKHLECILENKSQFLAICKLEFKRADMRDVETVLQWREEELKSLKSENTWVDSLLKMCQSVEPFVTVHISEIQGKHSADLGLLKLNELMSVKKLDSPQLEPGDCMNYYNLGQSVMSMAENLHNYRKSHIFKNCWKEEAQSLADRSQNEEEEEEENEEEEDHELSLEGMKEELFTPCFDKYKKIYEDLKNDRVTFEVVDRLFNDYKNRYQELKEELQIMCQLGSRDGGQWIGSRVLQIEQYHKLNSAFDSANVIAKVKDCFNLSGDFKTLQTLLQFADDFENYKHKALSCISEEVIKTKQVLSEITEVRTQCLQEVTLRKDFIIWVKEALEDINELKVFVDLASISAGENDMDVDRVACFHDAVLGYSSLLYELKPDCGFDNLMRCLQKLWKALESDRNLPKKLRDSARHIEWLKTVKESHGSVELSSLSLATAINQKGIYIIQAPDANKKITPDSVLRLDLPEGDEDVRCCTLEELKELLNKLMLMSGKGDQGNIEVEKFSEVFFNVQRLANSFIDLYLAGNMLFRTWEATIYCSDDRKVGVKMNFKVNVTGEIEGQGALIELLPNICKTMESFLEQWMNFVNKKRSQLYYLNYYTAEQLVYLCQQFQRADIGEEALVMLSFIKPECTKYDTANATYSSRVASLSGSSKLSTGPDKAMFNFKLQSCTDVLKKLEMFWEYSMAYMSALFPGCLDIETLGKCLATLAAIKEKQVSRDFHPSLQQGHPNLVLCPPAEILSSAIAIYMHSVRHPLPSYDEVLLCTPQTTYEEVALFLRRCLTSGYSGKKIYSLLYADELSYDTAYKSEQLFQRLQAQNREDYNLVIICNCDREHCYIPSVFSQYKVHMIPQKPLPEIQQYLEQHFTVGPDVISAASVFKNGMGVGIVASKQAGLGKSLYVKRLYKKLASKLPGKKTLLKTIRLIKPQVDENKVLQMLLPFLRGEYKNRPIIFHVDVTSSVNSGISEFLFKLLVLQYLMDSEGRMWKRQPCHLYVIEILESSSLISKQSRLDPNVQQRNFIDIFPKISCCSPKEVMVRNTQNLTTEDCGDPGMDDEEFQSETFQRPFQYLIRFQQNQNLDTFLYIKKSVEGNPARCLQIFLLYCGMMDPSWSELRNFTWFLNLQLQDCESSTFCKHEFVGDTLQGFKNFVVNFMILMAKDFATPSLYIADQSPGKQTVNMNGVREEDLAPFLMRKKWESEPHPYIFFNDDHVSMTFIGFHLRPNNEGGVDAINPRNDQVIKRNIMTTQLYQGLQHQRVPFNIDFDQLPRDEKINRLCMVLGIQWPFDPDDTYELTMDNILKILAIKMRFRCGIPVVVMGETGCGKTRLIKFLCQLCKGFVNIENMKLVKVHGGTSADTIYSKILEAQAIAISNKQENQCDTVLFFDEANTTEAISSIKEAVCDRTVEGEPLIANSGLQIIAACNPYRKHTEEMIKRLESAGLGYRVKAEETKERLGSIPLRQLVYRVHALPPSMMPLVWDFGQLNNETEKKYIQQIVQRLANDLKISSSEIQLLTNVLSVSQSYMRKRNDECSFVSLRDVERCIEVFKWFYSHSKQLLNNLKEMCLKRNERFCSPPNIAVWSLVLAIGVCYHASLENKDTYRKAICKYFPEPYREQSAILCEITNMQDLFLTGVHIRDTIARNLALKENFFMMVICIELKIPLFLVGKPGSSKSLAKTIVADAMQGQAAHTDLYKYLKQIHLVSFQCSPHSTPEGIIGTFKHCARFQEGKNLNEYVSVVVLDEIGLAEDSPKMPLKTLHPLLEDGCIEDDPLPHKKVGFIGISNWALDPAKMNRGIFVSRGDPNKNELIQSAKGICSSNNLILEKVESYFSVFAEAYQSICKTQKKHHKEFFGLRDFYSLIKMVFAFTKNSQKEPTAREIARAVLRNFSGKDEVNALNIFTSNQGGIKDSEDINTIDLVRENITSDSDDSECRYLLILTKNYAALQILNQDLQQKQPEVIFGSSFPKDQEYTQICRNINRVKICMETGQMVILLNLQNLYESLYDALNQYYVYLAGQKYVDLGLGTHRVKCRVHPNFRLIVIEEKEVVYKDFPIPLINRLEKHYLDINTVLNKIQKAIVQDLEDWIKDFTTVNTEQFMVGQQKYSPSDVFIGYHSDTCASVILQVTEMLKQKYPSNEDIMKEVKNEAKSVLLNCATPDSVIRLGRKPQVDEYFKKQKHSSLVDFLCCHIHSGDQCHTVFTEITTFSRLLTSADKKILEVEVQDQVKSIEVLSLQQFDTEHSFLKKIRGFLEGSSGNKILIIQTDFEDGSQGAHLVASAKYSAVNEINKVNLEAVSVFVYFITKLPRMQGGTSYVGFHGGLWQSVHIDDLRKSKDMVSDITALQDLTISQLFFDDVIVAGSEIRQETDRESESKRTESSPSIAMETEMEIEMGQMNHDTEAHHVMDFEQNSGAEMDTSDMGKETNTENEMETEMEMPELAKAENVLDTTILIRSCVQNAVGMLRDKELLPSRSTRRIEILIHLLSTEDEMRASFLKKLKVRLHGILKDQEENSYNAKEWVVREASNPDALQEAGTFRHTLWKRIQAAVTPFLAHLVSIVDCDANLELLVNPGSEDFVKSLWMFIFSDEKLLNISYKPNKSSSQTDTILVQNCMNISMCEGNCTPFSWRIKDYLEEIWAQAQYIHTLEGPAMKFVSIFSQAPLGQYIAGWKDSDRDKLLLNYKRDFILLTMNVSSTGELQFLEFALSSCIEEMRGEEELTLPWVHLGYYQFQHRLQTFSRIVAIRPTVLDALGLRISELESMMSSAMALDVFAAFACLEMLEVSVLEPSPQAWLRQVKNLQMPIELICSENYLQGRSPRCKQTIEQIKIGWNCVFSMALFVEHVLIEECVQHSEMQELLKTHTIFLGKCLQGYVDIKSKRPFLAVIDVLRKCRDAVATLLLRFGIQICLICREDPKEPVQLGCHHMYCQSCIKRWIATGQKNCPTCKSELPDNFPISVSKELSDAIQKNVRFRQLCNGFFIDMICTLCFKDNTPPDADVIDQLLSLLFINKDALNTESGQRRYTKSLSPFEDSVDKTPVIRSVILKLLLKYSFDDIKSYVQQYLSTVQDSHILSEEDSTEVYMLFINCLEDSMYEKTQAHSDGDQTIYLREEGSFLKDYMQNSNHHGPRESSIQFLQAVARIRLALDMAAELLTEAHTQGTNKNEEFLQNVKDLCTQSSNDWYRVYLIRKLANQYGMVTVQKLFKDRNYSWLFPPQIIQKKEDQSCNIDLFLVCGNSYRLLRDGIGKALIECKEESIVKAQEECKSPDCEQAVHLLLAVFREITMRYGFPNTMTQATVAKREPVKTFIQNAKVLQEGAVNQFAQSLLNNSRPTLIVLPGMTSLRCTTVGLAIHLAAVLLSGKNNLLEPLKNLAFSPVTMQNSYLPTMPEDMLVQAKNVLQRENVRWYVCPNNHYCAVGECGQPMQLSRCIDCGAQVGGENHRPHVGFTTIQGEGDRTQTGHILGDPERQGSAVAPDREISRPAFILLRLLTHLSMILGAEENPQGLMVILKPQVQDAGTFLFRHIEKDLEYLKNTLGKSADETATVVHLILCSLTHQQPGQWPVRFDGTLSTKESRNNWEQIMATTVISPVLKSLDKKLLKVNNDISKDERISSNPIVKIVYGDPLINGDPMTLPRDSHVHCSKIWTCRTRISIEYLRHVAQQKDGKDLVPILWKFLENEVEFRMVKFLPEILNLQKELVKKFQICRDMDSQKIKDFLSSIKSDGSRHIFKKRVETFMSAWNHLRHSLHTNGEIKLPEGICDENITMESDFAMLLPRRQGLGLCATALVSYLITLHNNFVYTVEKYTVEKYTEDEQKYSISASEVMDLHVISYDMEKDLMPVILSNCQYSVESGGETLQELDLDKIQRQFTSRFLQGKPLITAVGLPTLIHSHDRNYENIFTDVKKRLSQESLPNSTINSIGRDLNSYSDVCEALSIAEVTLGFLAASGGDPDILLTSYVENVLQMGEQTNTHVLEALKRCNLKHTIALWQLLTALKSEHLLRLKRDPFAEVDKAYKAELKRGSRQQLNVFLEQNGLDLFLLELHEMIILKLKKPQGADTFKPAWSLRDTLGPLIEGKDIFFPELDSEFPEEITLAHCIEAWKVAAKMKRNRLLR